MDDPIITQRRKIENSSTPTYSSILCGHLFNPRTLKFEKDVTLQLDPAGNIIQKIQTKFLEKTVPQDVLDLRTAYVLPGLIDCHVHPLIASEDYQYHHLQKSSAYKALHGLYNVQGMLREGWTTIRIAGDADVFYAHLEIKKIIEEGLFEGPTISGAGHYISVTGGGGDIQHISPEQQIISDGLIVDGKAEMIKAIRKEIKNGSDWIKLLVSGAFMSSQDSPLITNMSEEELLTAVLEATRWKVPVMAHCHSTDGIKESIKAGVRSVEHASFIDQEGIDLAIQYGTWIVPTLYVGEYSRKSYSEDGPLSKMLDYQKKLGDQFEQSMKALLTSKCKIAVGTDYIGWKNFKENAQELNLLVSWGLTPERTLEAATLSGAELLRNDRIGVLEPGRYADLIAVEENPLEKIQVLQNIPFVMKRGVVIKNERG